MSSKIIGVKGQVAAPTGWQRPPGWPDISEVNDNEINLLFGKGTATFVVRFSGTFSVDWGDGTVSHNLSGNTDITHEWTSGGILCTDGHGYMVFPVRIFNATGDIQGFQFKKDPRFDSEERVNVLWAVFGTRKFTSYYYGAGEGVFFNNQSGNLYSNLRACTIKSFEAATSARELFNRCFSLEYVELPESWGELDSVRQMFTYCTTLQTVTLPTSWGKVTTVESMFAYAAALTKVTIPVSWGSVQTAAAMFLNTALRGIVLPSTFGNILSNISQLLSGTHIVSAKLPISIGNVNNMNAVFAGCKVLERVELPSDWGNVTTIASLFSGCNSLTYVKFPSASLPRAISTSYLFSSCIRLKEVVNLSSFGENTNYQLDLAEAFWVVGLMSLELRCAISKIKCSGGSVVRKIPIQSIRFLNPLSLFGGTSAQVDIRYCDLSDTALNTLFEDLPTLTGKTINITGCTGAATCNKSIATAKGWIVTG